MGAESSVAMAALNPLRLLAIGAAIALLAGCDTTDSSRAAGRNPAENNRTPPAVDVFEVRSNPRPAERLVPAVISVEDHAVVLAQRPGVLIRLLSEVGARVSEGDLLGELSSDDLRAQLRQHESEAESSKSHERQLEALLRVNQSEEVQDAELFQAGLISLRQLERTRYRVEGTRHELDMVRLATRAALAKVEATGLEVDKGLIRAPLTGIVTRRFVTRGSTLTKDAKLFEVSRLEPLQVLFHVERKDSDGLAVGGVVRVSAADKPGAETTARIRRVDPTADAESNTLGILADLVRPEGFIPGAAVTVRVTGAAPDAAVWIPRAAFLDPAGLKSARLSKVLVIEGERCATRTVLVGSVGAAEVSVESGLSPGDRVILAPGAHLRPGDSVAVRKP